MNKLFTKIAALALGATMAVGVGVAVASTSKNAEQVSAADTTYTFTSASWADSTSSWTSDKAGGQLTSGRGVQVTTSASGAGAHTKTSISNVSAIEFTYSTNKSAGAGSISVTIGENTAVTYSVTKTGGTSDRTTNHTYTTAQSGVITFAVTCSTNSIYVKSIKITTSSGKTIDSLTTDPDDGDTVNLDADGASSVNSSVLYEVGYSDSSTGYDVESSCSPSAGVTLTDDEAGVLSLSFAANGTFDVTIEADENHSATITFVVTGIPTVEYELYTGSIVAGDYVIMSGDANYTYVLGNTVSSNRIANGTTNVPIVSSGTITNPSSDYVWHIAKNGNYWTIQNAANDKYLAGKTAKNNADLVSSVDDHAKWTPTHSTNWVFENLGRASDSDTPANRYLRNNTTSGWACYSSTQGNAPALFKLVSTNPAIEVAVTGSQSLGVGETATLTATKINGATGTVGWATSNSSILSISAATGDSITVTAGSTLGSATITASLTGCDNVETVFTVRNGSATSPYTVAQAIAAATGGDAGAKTGVYTSGIVSQVSSLNSDNSITYYISDNGTTTNQMEVFKGFGLNSATFSSVDDLQVGDEVVVYGDLTLYSSTPEYASGNHLYSFNRPVIELDTITAIEGTLNAKAGDPAWDLSGLIVKGTYTGSATEHDVTALVDLTTSDVPGNPSSTTVRNVSITATSKEDSSITLTQNVQGTITVNTGLVAVGNYRINATRDSVTYYLKENGTSSAPSAVTDFWEATVFTFTLVADNTYTISHGDNYLYCTSTNNGVRFGNTSLATEERWTISAGEGTLSGSYNLYSAKGSRYLTLYAATDADPSDWRGYTSATATNRKENTDLQAFDADQYSAEFLSTYTAGCNVDGGYTPSDMKWEIASTQFGLLSSDNQGLLTDAEYTKTGAGSSTVITPVGDTTQSVAEAAARYDYIVGKYGTDTFADFMDRSPDPVSNSKITVSIFANESTSAVTIVVIVSLVSLTAIGGYFFIKRRKEN